jgi:hypothetical protein
MAVPIFLADAEIGAVSGHCRALNGDRNLLTKIQDSWYEGQYSVRKAFESVFGAVTCVSGPLAFSAGQLSIILYRPGRQIRF